MLFFFTQLLFYVLEKCFNAKFELLRCEWLPLTLYYLCFNLFSDVYDFYR